MAPASKPELSRARSSRAKQSRVKAPDLAAPAFRSAAHRQSLAVAASSRDRDDQAFTDSVSEFGDGVDGDE